MRAQAARGPSPTSGTVSRSPLSYGSFHEVRQHERIVWTFTYEGEPDAVALETLTFEEIEDGRTRLRVLSVVRDFQTRDGMLSSGMDVGVNEGYDKLDELLVMGA
jgi:uncharacterized protein YndB with AHSA1/START domain